MTGAHNLKHKGIIHTPGPIWREGNEREADLLANSYRNSLTAAHERTARSIAFCSISTGSYRYPITEAAVIAFSTVRDWISANPSPTIERIVFAMYGEIELQTFSKVLES